MSRKKRDINPKIMRWSLILENFEYILEHRKGEGMRHVDALSRCFENVLIIEDTPFETNLSIKQCQVSEIKKIRELLELSEHKDFELNNGLIYRNFSK